jgi:multiple sugar transport system substrate-binding protein
MSENRRVLAAAAVAAVAAAAAAGCSGSGPAKSVPGTARQTIVFAEAGLGTEGAATQAAINAFHQANPSITVKTDVLSTDSTTYLTQLENAFTAGSATPDVFESDVTYPAKFAQAGWVLNLSSLHPGMSRFFPHEAAAATCNGQPYAVPWYDNPEGLFYRTDLITSPPASPAQVVSDALAAMKADKSLKEGLAFEGTKYEGEITALLTVEPAFGGRLDPANIGTPANVAALTWLHDAIYKYRIAPAAVTGWREGNVQQEFSSGHAAFAIDYPFVETAPSAPAVKGHIGFIPFPPGPGGTPGSALGGEMLAINARTAHVAAAWKLIRYLTSAPAQIARAKATGDPPSLPGVYTPALYAAAPYFKIVKLLNSYSQPRPVTPNYPTVSDDLTVMLSEVLANSMPPAAALRSEAPAIKNDAAATPGG